MNWGEAVSGFLQRHQGQLSWKETCVMTEYKEDNLSIAGLWSWRGKIWAKYEGSYPEPSAVGLPADDTFFDKDYICFSQTFDADMNLCKQEWYHHGRRLTERSKLWAKRPLT
jgi:hypothetical protein